MLLGLKEFQVYGSEREQMELFLECQCSSHWGEGGQSGKASFKGGILRQGWGVQKLRIWLGGRGTLTALTHWAALTWVPVPGLPPSARLPPGYLASSHFLISPQTKNFPF